MKYPADRTPDNNFLSGILLVQIVATYLVILGHSYPFVTGFPEWLDQTRTFLYLFHMPLFVWVSGYLLVYTRQAEKYTAGIYMVRRTAKLLVPYLILSIVALLPKHVVQPLSERFC